MMQKRWSLLLTLILLHTIVGAQSIRITPITSASALYLNTNSLFNFNRYDMLRVDADLRFVYPSQNHPFYSRSKRQWQINPYIGYATRSEQWHGGVTIARQSVVSHQLCPYVVIRHDIDPAASTNLAAYQMTQIAENSGFLADRMAQNTSVAIGMSMKATSNLKLDISLQHSRECYLFDSQGFLIYDPQTVDQQSFYDIRCRMNISQRLTIALWAGQRRWLTTSGYWRCIAQYEQSINAFGRYKASLFAQIGYSNLTAPYSRLFDISGTAGCPYFFNHTFITLTPNEFQANAYAKMSLTITDSRPLWQNRYSMPQLFARINVLSGWLVTDTGWTDHSVCDNIAVNAPSQGVIEPAIGCNQLLRIGLIDMGIAAAYRITSPTAYYHHPNASENIAIAATATLRI
ncbi:MAG: hypothetical protein KBT04_00250 [Bacteroidales bacterium]|nr:hypothetical protein [Candidatus Colimorpha onthohippi]